MKIFFDTSVLIASLVRSHPHHVRAMPTIRRVMDGKDAGYVAAHGLAETYAVLTTLPVVPRIGPEAADKLLRENIIRTFRSVALGARDYERLVLGLAGRGISGGAVYDAIQVECAMRIAADRVYTFNVEHFRRIAGDVADRVTAP